MLLILERHRPPLLTEACFPSTGATQSCNDVLQHPEALSFAALLFQKLQQQRRL